MIRKKFKKFKRHKKVKAVKTLVTDNVIDKAAQINPLAEKPETPLTDENVPRITNETIAEHREEVLSGARKYIYPLRHSKHRIVVITATIMSGVIVAFLIYCTLGLYKFYQTNAFLYRVTQVVPFPVAKIDSSFVNYENYLFEMRHYVHYYESQQQSNLSTPGGLNASFSSEQQILAYRKQALQTVINDAYVKKLAVANNLGVSGGEVDERINVVREQNRLGSNNKVFADVLRSYWGWSINDFKRSLKQEILAEKVVAKLDTETTNRAANALAQLKGGADFAALAKEVSDDGSKSNGGDYGFGITKNNPNIPPQVVAELFRLKAGQFSGVINTGTTLEIVKLIQTDGTTVSAQHIVFKLKDINYFVDQYKAKHPAKAYIKF